MASAIGKCIDEAIKTGLAPLLKEHGFTKKNRAFHKTAGEAVQVVEVLSWKYNAGNSGRFTINLGVYFPEVAEIAETWVCDSPEAHQCTVSIRLGNLMPKQQDTWWKLRPKRWWDLRYRFDPDTVADRVSDAMRNFGLPWLENTAKRDGLRKSLAHWAIVNDPLHPLEPYALEMLDGRKDEAARLLRRKIDSTKFEPHAERLREWGKKQGLI